MLIHEKHFIIDNFLNNLRIAFYNMNSDRMIHTIKALEILLDESSKLLEEWKEVLCHILQKKKGIIGISF